MTTLSIDAVGLCAHFSTQGDWAFDYAFSLARRREVPLNIFHFLADPFDPQDRTGAGLAPDERARLIIERERQLRFRWEDKLGDFLIAGFRLCEENEWTELHRCLTKREFQVLVLPRPTRACTFGRRTLEEFADAFVCPIVAVGPSSPYDLSLNQPAIQVLDQLGLTPNGVWSPISGAPAPDQPGCSLAVLSSMT
jgi:hypothetical protein